LQLPEPLLQSLIGVSGFNREAFTALHESEDKVVSIRVNAAKAQLLDIGFLETTPVPWCAQGHYLSVRPSFTFDPLFHAGCYYVQDASSMFLEQIIKQHVDTKAALTVLDISAAPGGKSTHLLSLLSKESTVVCNDVIGNRVSILKENIIKWGYANVVVTNSDPNHFTKLEGVFDILLVDAPCSGSGLWRKNEESIEEWSEGNVALCAKRQKRIVTDLMPALKPGGLIIYSTCSYSPEENEEMVDEILTNENITSCRVVLQPDWGIVETVSEKDGHGYRFWPYLSKGEGFFIAAFKKGETEQKEARLNVKSLQKVSLSEMQVLRNWVDGEEAVFVKNGALIYSIPALHVSILEKLLAAVRVIYFGVLLGEIKQSVLIPDHALALNHWMHTQAEGLEVDSENAIAYLRKETLPVFNKKPGWYVFRYKGVNLGWVKILANRTNNYFPTAWRILKKR